MRTSSNERIDQLALVWLMVPRKKSTPSDFRDQLKGVDSGADYRKRLARECFARLRERGLIAPGRRLEITDAGRRAALELLGVAGLPQSKTALKWAKKVLLLRSLGVNATPSALETASQADALAARVLIRHHKLDQRIEPSASKVAAALARRALGLDEGSTFEFDEVFTALFLGTAQEQSDDADRGSAPASSTVSLKLGECELPAFARLVAEAARSSLSGRWHGAVFISHVWDTLKARGKVDITFEKFQRRLIEAYQADLVDLSRADLVDAMNASDVSASETVHSGARFHFVRLERLAS